jgi:hypothetical protein
VAPQTPAGTGDEIAIGADGDAPAPGGAATAGEGVGYSDTDPAALTDFHTALDPYGNWAEDSSYGTVWVPSQSVVGSDFSPYVSAGHWVYDTDYTWVSDYGWGWAPFHYGRWVWIGGRGWSWVPGRVYSGAWVSWRTGYDNWGYVGWAPLPPTWCWRGGIAVGIGVVPPAPYVFVGSGHVFAGYLGPHLVTGPNVAVIAGHTRPYVVASPGVTGHVFANPGVNGPPPGSIGIPPNNVVHAPVNNAGLAQARSFATPASATALGARPPAQLASNSAIRTPGALHGTTGLPGSTTLGAHSAPVATAQQYRGVSPTPYHAPYSAPSTASRSFSSPLPYMPSRGSTVASSGAYHGAPTYVAPHSSFAPSGTPHYSAPAYHPSGSYGGAYSGHVSSSGGGGFHSSGGGFHGGGGGHSGGGHHR